jgi:hypothetical protein
LPTFFTSKIDGALMSYQSEESIDIRVVNRVKWTHTLAREGVDDLLLDTLLTLGQSLVLP